MSGNYFQLSPVLVNGVTTLAGIQDVQENPGIEVYLSQSDGSVSGMLATVAKAAPALTVPTLNIKQALDLLATTGPVPFLILTGLTWSDKKQAAGGPTFAAGSTSEQKAATAGLLYFAGLEAGANTPAMLTLAAQLASTDGLTDPIAPTLVTAPTEPASIVPYFLDSVTMDGTLIDEIESISITPGVALQIEHGLRPYPVLVRVRAVDWTITVRHRDATFHRIKTNAKDTSIAVVLKAANSGGPTRGASTVNFTINGLLYNAGSGRPTGGQSEYTTTLRGRRNGATQSATWSTT